MHVCCVQLNRVNWYKHGLDIAIDVAQALHFLHCRNIIHFDCKSPNILLSTTNSAKLAGADGAWGWNQKVFEYVAVCRGSVAANYYHQHKLVHLRPILVPPPPPPPPPFLISSFYFSHYLP